MPLETGTYISDLVATNPTNADFKNFGDDHLRLLKSVLKNSLPGVSGAVTATHTELNYVDGVTSNIQTQIDDLSAFVANASFSAALPDQTGNAGKFITTDGANGSWSSDINATVMKWADGDKRIGFNLSSISSSTTRTFTWPDSNGTVVCADTAQTLNNKTINVSDTGFTLQDDADSSKKARFQLSGISSGTTRVYTLPDLNTELVSQSAAQTLTNKTITVDDNKFLIVDSLDGSKQVEFFLNNLTTGNKRVITVPDKDITLGESGLVPVANIAAVNAATVDVTWSSGQYDSFVLYVTNLKVDLTGGTPIYMYMRLGGTYVTSGYYGIYSPDQSDLYTNASEIIINLGNGVGTLPSPTSKPLSFKIEFQGTNVSGFTKSLRMVTNSYTDTNSGRRDYVIGETAWFNTSTSDFTGLRFQCGNTSGNISGNFRLYGLAQ